MGHLDIQAVAEVPLRIEWTHEAVEDLQRFAAFLHARHPGQAAILAAAIVEKTGALALQPEAGRPTDKPNNRKILIRALSAFYDLRYRIDGDRIVVLRIFHSREDRD